MRSVILNVRGWVVVLAILLVNCGKAPPVQVRMTGTDHRWTMVYAGPDGIWNTMDDLESSEGLKLPALTSVILTFESTDFIYTFSLPQLDLKQMAVPELQYTLAFRTPRAGVYPFEGGQMCGLPITGTLNGEMLIQKPKDFQDFYNRLKKDAPLGMAKNGAGEKPNPDFESP